MTQSAPEEAIWSRETPLSNRFEVPDAAGVRQD